MTLNLGVEIDLEVPRKCDTENWSKVLTQNSGGLDGTARLSCDVFNQT
jgi:hypothetical protein